eukprot:COSAG01_NODE_10845_length_2068_cov_38.191468_1_plen_187_part_00
MRARRPNNVSLYRGILAWRHARRLQLHACPYALCIMNACCVTCYVRGCVAHCPECQYWVRQPMLIAPSLLRRRGRRSPATISRSDTHAAPIMSYCYFMIRTAAVAGIPLRFYSAIAVSLIIDVGIPIGIVGPRQGHRALRRRGWGAVPDGGAAGLPRVPHRVACQLLLRGLAGDLSHIPVHLLAPD